MSMFCPKTHHDTMLHHYPSWMESVNDIASKLPASKSAHVGDAIPLDMYFGHLKRHVIESYSVHRAASGLPEREFTFEEVAAISPSNVQSVMMMRQNDLATLVNYEIHGRKTFFFGGNLTEKLSETDINVSSELFTLPYPACMFVFDNQVARDALYAITGKEAPRNGTVSVYLMSFQTPKGTPVISMDMYLNHGVESLGVFARRQLALVAGSTIENVLDTDWSKVDDGQSFANSDGPSIVTNRSDEVFRQEGLKMVRILVNSALYLASSNPDIIPGLREAPLIDGRKPYVFEKRMFERTLTKSDYITVGNSVPGYEAPEASEGKKLDHRIKVRGHWKSQPHGPGRTLRMDKLIEPYWKGPDAAEIISKPFAVGSKKR